MIGGTGAINTMLYMRGNQHDYDHWEDLGNFGWSYRHCLPYFRKLENMQNDVMAKDGKLRKTGLYLLTYVYQKPSLVICDIVRA